MKWNYVNLWKSVKNHSSNYVINEMSKFFSDFKSEKDDILACVKGGFDGTVVFFVDGFGDTLVVFFGEFFLLFISLFNITYLFFGLLVFTLALARIFPKVDSNIIKWWGNKLKICEW